MEGKGTGSKKEIALPNTTSLKAKNEPWTPDDKALLARAIGRVFVLQRLYGKSTDDIGVMVEGFAWALRPYPVDLVIDGIRQFILDSPNVPTPSEIKEIIDPAEEPFKPDWNVYASFKKMKEDSGPYALNDEEIRYLQACEEHSLMKLRKQN